MSAQDFHETNNSRSGLLGVSETSSDKRDLLECETHDLRAAEAVALICYDVKKRIGAFAAALGGVDTLVFCGGIGENCPAVWNRICIGLEFLVIELVARSNAENATPISPVTGPTSVRVIATDEEQMIARSVCRFLDMPVNEFHSAIPK